MGDGDQDAWNELVERYSPLVWSICLRYRLDRDDIEDVRQSVWTLLLERVGTLREPAAPLDLEVAIMTNVTRNHPCIEH